MKKALILRGGPVVGKSSASAALASLLPRSALIEQDLLRYMVVGGLVATKSNVKPAENPREYFRQCRLGDKNAFALARNFIEAGFLVIISGLNGGESAETFHLIEHPIDVKWYPEHSVFEKELPGITVHQIILDARPKALINRMKERGWGEQVIQFVLTQRDIFLAAAKNVGISSMIDTSNTNPLSVAKKIISELRLQGFQDG